MTVERLGAPGTELFGRLGQETAEISGSWADPLGVCPADTNSAAPVASDSTFFTRLLMSMPLGLLRDADRTGGRGRCVDRITSWAWATYRRAFEVRT